MLPSGTTLQTVLPPSLYRRSENYVRSHGYSMSLFNSFKIWAFAGSLEMLDYMDDMVTKKPLDIYIYNAASSLGKGLCGVETLEEQVDLFDSFTTNEQLKMLNMTLTQLEDSEARGVDAIQALVDAYLAGDEQALSDKSTEGLDLSDPFIQKYLDTIMISRNHRMASRMASKIRAEPGKSFFFAVGSAHYPGDEGILALLRADGYIVSRMVPTTAEDKARWSPAGIPSGASSGGDWCPSGLTQNYNIAQAGGDVAVEFVGLEMRNGKQMCHIVITYGAYDTSIDAWIDEQGGYDIGGLGGMGLGGSGGLGGSSGLDLFG
jgi:uncharacterized protein YbaP (TraB family)